MFVMLARNEDVDRAVLSVRAAEDRFNRKYNYPYVFLNERPFSEELKWCPSLSPLLSVGLTENGSGHDLVHPYPDKFRRDDHMDVDPHIFI